MLKELIDKFYLDKSKDKPEIERTHFYISEAGRCPRMIFFRFKRAPGKEVEAERLRIFEYGDSLHKLILSPLLSLGLVRATEVEIPSKEIVFGRADAIISIDGQPYVLDIKSISGRMNLTKMQEPKPEDFCQIQLYLHFFKIPKGILLYVNKDTQELKEFIFDYKNDVAEKILKNFEILKSKIEANTVPLRIPDFPSNWQCQYCEYFEICKIGGAKEIEWENFKKIITSQTDLPR